MHIKILGPGCDKCLRLERATRDALHRLAVLATVELVTDAREIARHGVKQTPALLVDNHLVVAGRVPTAAELQCVLAAAPAA